MTTITDTASLTTATTSVTQSDSARETLTGNFQDFLMLFVAQLQNQDPLEPVESSEFTNSLANLSAVEQSVNMNSNMEKLLAAYESSQVNDSASYIDKSVEFASSAFELSDGQGSFSYTLSEGSQATPIAITDESGNLILQTLGLTSTGKHSFQWDGKDVEGNQMPDGVYRITVGAEDSEGEITNLPTTGTGRVTGVSFENGETTIELLNVGISKEDVISIRSNNI